MSTPESETRTDFQPISNMPPTAGPTKHPSIPAIIGLALSIITFLLSWLTTINVLIFILGITALTFAIVGIVQTRPREQFRGAAIAITGCALSITSLFLIFCIQVGLSNTQITTVSAAPCTPQTPDSSPSPESTPNSDQSTPSSTTTSSAPTDSSSADMKNGTLHIEILSVAKSVDTFDGRPTVAVTYTVTNNGNNTSNPFDYQVKAFQNKVELSTGIYNAEKPEGYDIEAQLKEIQPGGSLTIVNGFILEDTSAPITIEVDSLFDSRKAIIKDYPLS